MYEMSIYWTKTKPTLTILRLLLAFLENHLPTVKTDVLKQLTQLTYPNKEVKFFKNQLHESIDNLETAPLASLQGTLNPQILLLNLMLLKLI